MAELKVYRCVVNGHPALLRLNEEDAKALNAEPVDQPEQAQPVTTFPPEDAPSGKARPSVANKARTSPSKDEQ